MTKRKTGLGVDAFFPEEDLEIKTTHDKQPSASRTTPRRRTSTTKSKNSTSSAKPESETAKDQDEKIERRPAWIRLDHLARLDALKHLERKRLRREKKRVSRSTLLDEAIDRYLAEKEK